MLHHLPPLVLLPHFLASVPPWVENIWNIWLKFDFWALPFHNWILWLELYSYIDYIWVYTKLWFFQRSPNRSWRNEKLRHSANDRLNWTRWRPFFLGRRGKYYSQNNFLSSLSLLVLNNNVKYSRHRSCSQFKRSLETAVLLWWDSAPPRRTTACSSVTKTNAHAFPASSVTGGTGTRSRLLNWVVPEGAGGPGQLLRRLVYLAAKLQDTVGVNHSENVAWNNYLDEV